MQEIMPAEWKSRLEEEKARLFAQLGALEAGGLSQQENAALQEEICGTLAALRRERDAMIGCLTQEAGFIDEAETRLKEINRVHRRFHILPPAPTNGQIDSQERRSRHFAQGMSLYKLFWVFFIGCFLGVVVERVWCFVRYGLYEPRVGLIYGPFNLVYGLGAWALTAALYPFRNRSKVFSFVGGAVVGSAVEYFCSWFQEIAFGSASWDYSGQPFNLNGRICLLYAIYWGVLGMMWIKDFYPRMAQLILKIPNRLGKGLTIALAAFMLFNALMTGATVLRWMNRRQGEPPRGAAEAYLDRRYPDERMEAIFSNLVFSDAKE